MSSTCAAVGCHNQAGESCGQCGQQSCLDDVIRQHRVASTGFAVGGYAVTQQGYVSTGLCVSCRDAGDTAKAKGLAGAETAEQFLAALANPPVHRGAPSNVEGLRAWGAAMRAGWVGLTSKGVLPEAGEDIVEVVVTGKNHKLNLEEVARKRAWRAPKSGTFTTSNAGGRDRGNGMDTWVDEDVQQWAPNVAAQPDGGGLWHLERDRKGVVYGPNLREQSGLVEQQTATGRDRHAVLFIVVDRNERLATDTLWKGGSRTVSLRSGVVVTSRHKPGSPFSPKYSLADALRVVLAA